MKIDQRHPWPDRIEDAIAIQEQLRSEVIPRDELKTVDSVAGVDVGFTDGGETTRAAVVILSFPDLKLQETAIAYRPTRFPYVPGFLSFREIPAILDALEKLTLTPQLILCDGQGIAHPRRFGLACHLGVLTQLSTIGVAKSLFIGKHDLLAPERGATQPLIDRGETIGTVLRTRHNINPVYVSIGHKISLETAVDYVLRCTPKYRLPETTRLADKLASDR